MMLGNFCSYHTRLSNAILKTLAKELKQILMYLNDVNLITFIKRALYQCNYTGKEMQYCGIMLTEDENIICLTREKFGSAEKNRSKLFSMSNPGFHP